MTQKITKGIRISVTSNFEGILQKNLLENYAFSYTITIENTGKNTVQLMSRHWIIKDALNHIEEVVGDGVIGQQPVIEPGERHTYSSGCLLRAPVGSMRGWYHMINLENKTLFKVRIPPFQLSAQFCLN